MKLPYETRLAVVKGKIADSANIYADCHDLGANDVVILLRQIADEIEGLPPSVNISVPKSFIDTFLRKRP